MTPSKVLDAETVGNGIIGASGSRVRWSARKPFAPLAVAGCPREQVVCRRAGDDPSAELRQTGCVICVAEKLGEVPGSGRVELQFRLTDQKLPLLCVPCRNALRPAGFDAFRSEAVAPEFHPVFREVFLF